MRVINYPCAFDSDTAVALGRFDGVHLAHKAVISKAADCRERGLVPVVFTFCDNPGKSTQNVLTAEDEKQRLIASCGIDIQVNSAFDAVKDLSAEEFVSRVLCKALRAKEVFCGYNYRFAKNASADVNVLRELCKEQGVAVTCIPEVEIEGQTVSSTAIRSLLQEGNVAEAKKLLGRPYAVSGRVIHGRGLGRTLSAPTLNIDVPLDKLLPKFGVYAAKAFVDGVEYNSVCNIGKKPTVGSEIPTVEAYLLDAKGDFYNTEATLELLEFIRPEQKFSDIESLQNAISKDISEARRIFDK
ncbi:MAG: bifunctional riboflavin kinase/FAD synthetase [Clostridia bacterium]|nr:bifunctional riboflavin kinase/FAD synthetase [Clostridia bacterium]